MNEQHELERTCLAGSLSAAIQPVSGGRPVPAQNGDAARFVLLAIWGFDVARVFGEEAHHDDRQQA